MRNNSSNIRQHFDSDGGLFYSVPVDLNELKNLTITDIKVDEKANNIYITTKDLRQFLLCEIDHQDNTQSWITSVTGNIDALIGTKIEDTFVVVSDEDEYVIWTQVFIRNKHAYVVFNWFSFTSGDEEDFIDFVEILNPFIED